MSSYKQAYDKEYRQRPEVKEREKKRRAIYNQRPEYKPMKRRWHQKYISSGKAKQNRGRKLIQARRWVADYKSAQGCLVCKEDCSACLILHHNGEKELEVSKMAAHQWGFEHIKAEAKRCIVLCANCHRKVHAGLICFG